MGIAIQDEEIKQSLIFYQEASCLKLLYSVLAFFFLAMFSANIALYILFIGKEQAPGNMKQFIFLGEGFYFVLLILIFRKVSQYKSGFLEGLRSATIVAIIASIAYVFYFYIMWYKTIMLLTGGNFFSTLSSSKFTFITVVINMGFSVLMFAYIMGISQYIKGLMARRVDRFHILFIGIVVNKLSCLLKLNQYQQT